MGGGKAIPQAAGWATVEGVFDRQVQIEGWDARRKKERICASARLGTPGKKPGGKAEKKKGEVRHEERRTNGTDATKS